MTKDQALQIEYKDNNYYVNLYAREDGIPKLVKVYGPFSEEEAIYFKTLDNLKRKKYKKRLLINNLKNKPCMDCNKVKSLKEMTFDHIKGNKKFDIADGCRKSWNQLQLEIDKCQVVCKICHNIREFMRGIARLTSVNDLAELLYRMENYCIINICEDDVKNVTN